jgi:hypothetical protein
MILLKNTKFSTIEIAFFLSFVSNVFCLGFIHEQQQQIAKLIERNNDLMFSLNKLNTKVASLHDEILCLKTKSVQTTPILLRYTDNFSSYEKPLLLFGTLALFLGLTYYVGSAVVTKIATFSVKMPVVPLFDFSACLTYLPFITQKKVITTLFTSINTTIKVTVFGDLIRDISFRSTDMNEFVSITEAVRLYLASIKSIDTGTLNNVTVTTGAETTELITKGLEFLL